MNQPYTILNSSKMKYQKLVNDSFSYSFASINFPVKLKFSMQKSAMETKLMESASSSMPCTCCLLVGLCDPHFMGHENDDLKVQPRYVQGMLNGKAKTCHVQGMLDEKDPLRFFVV